MTHRYMAGLLLSTVLALAALAAARLPAAQHLGLSALTLAILMGMAVGNTVYPRLAAACHDGVAFSRQTLLRAGIILFGFKLTFHDIAAVGWTGVLVDSLVITTTFLLAYRMGRLLGMDEQTVILIGAGSSICGAAAVLATEPVVRAPADKVAVAVATVVVFGTLAMFLWPLLYALLHAWGISEFRYGLFAGSTVHEVAQAAVAGRAISAQAMDTAVITKMLRVMMLAPFLLLLSAWRAGRQADRTGGRSRITVPWFALAFLAVAGLNSFKLLPAPALQILITLDNLLLAAAMAALGIGTQLGAVRQAGTRPLLLATVLFVWLAIGGGAINATAAWLLR